jgi:hypothetical protein
MSSGTEAMLTEDKAFVALLGRLDACLKERSIMDCRLWIVMLEEIPNSDMRSVGGGKSAAQPATRVSRTLKRLLEAGYKAITISKSDRSAFCLAVMQRGIDCAQCRLHACNAPPVIRECFSKD